MENQLQLNAKRIKLLNKFSKAVPEFMDAEAKVLAVAYKEGALSTKVKLLIAMATAIIYFSCKRNSHAGITLTLAGIRFGSQSFKIRMASAFGSSFRASSNPANSR